MLKRLYWTLYLGFHYLKQYRYPFRSRAAVRNDQSRRIQRMVAHAYRFVPYYRETLDRLGLRPSDFRTVDDLARLPVLERRQIQFAPERFLSSARSARPQRMFSHGGAARERRSRFITGWTRSSRRPSMDSVIMMSSPLIFLFAEGPARRGFSPRQFPTP